MCGRTCARNASSIASWIATQGGGASSSPQQLHTTAVAGTRSVDGGGTLGGASWFAAVSPAPATAALSVRLARRRCAMARARACPPDGTFQDLRALKTSAALPPPGRAGVRPTLPLLPPPTTSASALPPAPTLSARDAKLSARDLGGDEWTGECDSGWSAVECALPSEARLVSRFLARRAVCRAFRITCSNALGKRGRSGVGVASCERAAAPPASSSLAALCRRSCSRARARALSVRFRRLRRRRRVSASASIPVASAPIAEASSPAASTSRTALVEFPWPATPPTSATPSTRRPRPPSRIIMRPISESVSLRSVEEGWRRKALGG